MNQPDTIHSPEKFEASQCSIECPYCFKTFGFDGTFNWWWVNQAIKIADPKSNITPMDFDGVIERRCHYIIFETKDEGVKIPKGQQIALNRVIEAKSVCVMKVWGKDTPIKFNSVLRFRSGKQVHEEAVGYKAAIDYVRRWFMWANKE